MKRPERLTTMMPLRTLGQTDTGRRRQDNQDTFISTALWSAHSALLVVIDGVGGYAGGAQAAAIAKDAITTYMAAPTGDTLTMLREAVVHANNQIVRQRQQDPGLAHMCCVLTAAVADAEARRLWFVHVGDTRLYRFREGQLEKLTHDHSLVGVREDANQLTEREAMHHPRRNEILRDVGSEMHRVDDPDFLESGEADFRPGDSLLLCSDGLTDMLTRAQITDVLLEAGPVEEQLNELIRQANEQGGHDNITVVLADYPTSDENSEPVESEPDAPHVAEPEAGSSVAPVTAPRRTGWLVALLLGFVMLGVGGWWLFQTPASPATQPVRSDTLPSVVRPAVPDTLAPTDTVRPVRPLSTTGTR